MISWLCLVVVFVVCGRPRFSLTPPFATTASFTMAATGTGFLTYVGETGVPTEVSVLTLNTGADLSALNAVTENPDSSTGPGVLMLYNYVSTSTM